MSSNPIRLGFMGFGEAAQIFASDFSQAGITHLFAYSPSGAKALPGDPVQKKAQACGITLVKTPGALARHADIIIALTAGKLALGAARKITKSLRPHHFYIDASTNSATAMEKIAALIGDKAQFVDASIMGPVPVSRIKIPIVLSGREAEKVSALLNSLGMNTKFISPDPGAASAMKLIRSVCMKGLSGLLFESLEAAHRRGILDACVEDLSATFNDIAFEKIIKRFICGTATHAPRRIHEMSESLELLDSAHGYSRLTRATLSFMKDMAHSGLPEKFPQEHDSIEPVIKAWMQAHQ